MAVRSPETAPLMGYNADIDASLETAQLLDRIPERYRESLRKTQRIAEMVGSGLDIMTVESIYSIPPEPGAYIFSDQVDAQYRDIRAAKFKLETELLSGKVDSAHAVLPGQLSLLYVRDGKMTEHHLYVAAKGYYKRDLYDKFQRITSEVRTSHAQRVWGEIVYDPIAVVVAPKEYSGKGSDATDYDLLLLTRLDSATTSLDNAPWTLGFQPANLELAESAVAALGRFNTTIGRLGDAKIKNFVQYPGGKTSAIDFETSEGTDWTDPLSVATTVHEDLGKFLDSLKSLGFFAKEPHRSREVMEKLGQDYLEYWMRFTPDIQESAYMATTGVIDSCLAR